MATQRNGFTAAVKTAVSDEAMAMLKEENTKLSEELASVRRMAKTREDKYATETRDKINEVLGTHVSKRAARWTVAALLALVVVLLALLLAR